MKKILIYLSLFILLITGCTNNMNTPTKKVEEFLGKYQSMDSEVLTQLDDIVSTDTTMTDDEKKDYRSLMEKQYQNLSYKIKDEEIDGDNATVLVEIEVFDYATSINKSRKYYDEHPDEFKDEDKATINDDNKDNNKDDNTLGDKASDVVDSAKDKIEESSKYIEYKIKQMMNVTDKIKYEITFHLTKVNGTWKVDDISDIDRQKIHGLYEE